MAAKRRMKTALRAARFLCARVAIEDKEIFAHRQTSRKADWKLVLHIAENQPEKLGVEEENGDGDEPGDYGGNARIGEFAHFGAVAGELDEGNDGEGQLKTENHLAEDEQRSDLAFAGDADYENRRNDGDGASDEAAHPRLEPDVEKALHDDLSGQCAGKGGILTRG